MSTPCVQIVVGTVKENWRSWGPCNFVTGSRPTFWRKHLNQDGKAEGRSQPCGNETKILGRDWQETRSEVGTAWLTGGSERRPVWQEGVGTDSPTIRTWVGRASVH